MAEHDHESGGKSCRTKAQERRLKVSALPDPSRRMPALRLKGLWLERAGFIPAHPVRLRVYQGCIVIALD